MVFDRTLLKMNNTYQWFYGHQQRFQNITQNDETLSENMVAVCIHLLFWKENQKNWTESNQTQKNSAHQLKNTY